ncbi:hypothetical protein GCM10022198_25550 [Klugiella xanthotipulae]
MTHGTQPIHRYRDRGGTDTESARNITRAERAVLNEVLHGLQVGQVDTEFTGQPPLKLAAQFNQAMQMLARGAHACGRTLPSGVYLHNIHFIANLVSLTSEYFTAQL